MTFNTPENSTESASGTDHSRTAQNRDSLFADFWKSAVHAGVEAPVTAAGQLFNHDFKWEPIKPGATRPGSLDYFVQGVGGATGLIADMLPLKYGLGNLGKSGLAADLHLAPILRNPLGLTAVSGGLYGGFLTPIDPQYGNQAISRVKNAALTAGTFTALEGAGGKLSALGKPESRLGNAAHTIGVNAAVGAPIGMLNTHAQSLLFDHRLADLNKTKQAALDWAVIGGAMSAPRAIKELKANEGATDAISDGSDRSNREFKIVKKQDREKLEAFKNEQEHTGVMLKAREMSNDGSGSKRNLWIQHDGTKPAAQAKQADIIAACASDKMPATLSEKRVLPGTAGDTYMHPGTKAKNIIFSNDATLTYASGEQSWEPVRLGPQQANAAKAAEPSLNEQQITKLITDASSDWGFKPDIESFRSNRNERGKPIEDYITQNEATLLTLLKFEEHTEAADAAESHLRSRGSNAAFALDAAARGISIDDAARLSRLMANVNEYGTPLRDNVQEKELDLLRTLQYQNVPDLVSAIQSHLRSRSDKAAETAEFFLDISKPGREIYNAKDSLSSLIDELAPEIEERRWNAVIADDVSGRLPGRIIWEQMRKLANEHKVEPPKLYFMASGRSGVGSDANYHEKNQLNLTGQVAAMRDQLTPGRTLVVTDTIDSGNSIEKIAKALNSHGIQFDIAALKMDQHNPGLNMPGVNFFVAPDEVSLWSGGAGSDNYLRRAAGVEKYGADAITRATRKHQQSVNKLRKEIARLSQELYEENFGRYS